MGVIAGIIMKCCFFSFSPMPYSMAATWFMPNVVKGLVLVPC